ncbi:hypothetical protein MCEMSEM23_01423 [Rhabdaerophilaceae bacterium]
MCTFFLSRSAPPHVRSSRACKGNLPRFPLTERFDALCGVLKTKSAVVALALPVALASASAPSALAHGIRPNEMIVAEPWTGAALMGFDPISYFLDNDARLGSPQFQATFAGAAWFFHSQSNKAAFEESPESYLPIFGGYDPVAIASGVLVAGNPRIFVVEHGKLYLFRNAQNRALFLSQINLTLEAAQQWPELKHKLAP